MCKELRLMNNIIDDTFKTKDVKRIPRDKQKCIIKTVFVENTFMSHFNFESAIALGLRHVL